MRTLLLTLLCLWSQLSLASNQLFTVSVRDANMGDFAYYQVKNEQSGETSNLSRRPRSTAWLEVEGRERKVLRQLDFSGSIKGDIYLLQEDGFGDMRPKSLFYKSGDDQLLLETRGSSSREFIMTGLLNSKEVRITFEKFPGRSSRFDDSTYNAYGDDTFIRSYVSGTVWSYRVRVYGKPTNNQNKLIDQLASTLGILMLHIENPTSR